MKIFFLLKAPKLSKYLLIDYIDLSRLTVYIDYI